MGLTIVYDERYPPGITDLTPVVRAIKAHNPDVVFVGAYPPDSVGFVRAANEVGLVPKMIGGTMIGLLATPLKMQLGPLMNGYVNNAEVFVPIPTYKFPGVEELLSKYRERAKGKEWIHLVIISLHTVTPPAKCSPQRSEEPRVLIMPGLPNTSGITHLKPSWAR